MKRGARTPPRDAEARLAALVERWGLDQRAAARLRTLLELVGSDQRAATSVRSPAEAVHVHVADSLAALPWLEPSLPGREPTPARVVDLGSGAGFPGLPLAIARPALDVDLLEATRRKCEFLEHVRAVLELENAAVVNARAEEWAAGEGRRRYGLVLVRAVAPLATLAEYAAPLLVPGGRLLAWKGARDAGEEAAGMRAAELLGLEARTVERVEPYPGSRAHNLHLYEKVRPTPERFPRRAGAASKRPLG